MRARLFARYGPERGYEVEVGREASIGRGLDNQVVLTSPEVSQSHARVSFDATTGAYYLEDLGSLNGTRLDGAPVDNRERLGGLHVLTFGGAAELFFLVLDRDPEEPQLAPAVRGEGTRVDAEAPTLPPGLRRPAAAGTQVDREAPTLPPGLRADAGAGKSPGAATRVDEAPAALPPSLAAGPPRAAKAPAAAAGRWALVAGEPEERHLLVEGENLVGRTAAATVQLRHRELSRRHAVLRVEGERVWVRDEGSRNGTFAGGEAVTAEVELATGAELRFGSLPARLEASDD